MKKKTTVLAILLVILVFGTSSGQDLSEDYLLDDDFGNFSLLELKNKRKQRNIKKKINEGDKKIEQCLMDNPEDHDACLDLIIQRRKHRKKLSDFESGYIDDDQFESLAEALSKAVEESTQLRETIDDMRTESKAWRNKIPSGQQVGFGIILLAGLIPLIKGVSTWDDTKGKKGKRSATLGACLVTLGICGLYYFSSTK